MISFSIAKSINLSRSTDTNLKLEYFSNFGKSGSITLQSGHHPAVNSNTVCSFLILQIVFSF